MTHTATWQHGFECTAEGNVWNVWAPKAAQVDLVLIHESGERAVLPMKPQKFGWYQIRTADAEPGQRYLFRLNGRRELPDPASRWQPEGVHAPSALVFPQRFTWADQQWRGLSLQDLAIYELHVGTFTPEGTFEAIIPRLADLVDLGITGLELMPVAQFPGKRNWGYDGVYPFAVQNSYGGPHGLQRLIDACHAEGLAVFLDVVYNHLGPEGNYLAEFGPYFTQKYGTPWGSAWNYDDRGSDFVRQFVLDNVRHWLRDFHLDGLRLDAIHTIFDQSAVNLLRDIQCVAEAEAARANRRIHIIAESDLNDVRLLNPPEAGGYGLAGQWSDDFHHALHTLLTKEREGYYVDFGQPEQLVKALNRTFVHDGCYSQFRGRRHGAPAGNISGERFVVCLQNHDQIGNRALGDRYGSLLTPAQLRLAAGMLLLAPHTPLLFMGEEYGELNPFPFFSDFTDDTLRDAVSRGRRDEFAEFGWTDEIPDPQAESTFASALLSWNWTTLTWQTGLRNWYRDLLAARRVWPPLRNFRQREAVWHIRPPTIVVDVQTVTRGAELPCGILEVTRESAENEEMPQLLACFNFSPQVEVIRRGMPQQPNAVWFPLLSSESLRYGGSRGEMVAEADFLTTSEWKLLPWEVIIFSSRDGSSPWMST